LIPIKPFFNFHDWTSVKLNAGESALSTPLDDLEACRAQAQKIFDKLKEISDNQEANSIYDALMLVETLEKDIYYHEKNGASRANRLRKATRIIFREK